MDLGLFFILLVVGFGSISIGIACENEFFGVIGIISVIGLLIIGTVTPCGKWTYVKYPATGTIVNEQIIVQPKDPNISSIIETNMRFINKEVDIVEIQPRNVWKGNMGSMFQVELKGKVEK